jgi:hypothetical protein
MQSAAWQMANGTRRQCRPTALHLAKKMELKCFENPEKFELCRLFSRVLRSEMYK